MLAMQAIKHDIERIRNKTTRNPSIGKAEKRQAAEDIATLQKFNEQFRSYSLHLSPLIHENNMGILTLHPKHSHVKFRDPLLKLWLDNEPFILNVDQGSYPVRRSDYEPGTEVRFQYKYPTTILNAKA